MSTQLNLKPALLALVGLGLALGSALATEAAPAAATMQQVYTAETLYTCPMHAAVVAADPKQDCPLCEMHLTPMSAEARTAFVAQKLMGCPMDPIVVKAKDAANCPVCGMKLTLLAAPTLKAGASAAPAVAGCCKSGAGAEQTAPDAQKH